MLASFSLPDLIIPVPLHINRLRQRGFNQSLLLSRSCLRLRNARIDNSVLERTVATFPQAQLSGKERRSNLKNCFQLMEGADIRGKNILLVDDVVTTESTIVECAKTLQKGKPNRIEVFVLARSV